MIPRSKSTGDRILDTNYYSVTTDGNTWYESTSDSHLHRKQTSGFDIEDYHKRKKRGELLPQTGFVQKEETFILDLPVTFTYNTATQQSTYSNATNCGGGNSDVQDILIPHLPELPDSLLEDAQFYADRAAASIYSNGADALTFLAELTQTRRMFKNIAGRVWDIISSPSTKKAANWWLEARYGWRPLIGEIQQFQEAIASMDDKRRRYSERTGDSYVLTGGEEWDQVLTHYTMYYETSWTQEISLRGHVIADIDPPKFAFNPIVTAWEIVPLSFVIDWAFNVGMYLESMSFLVMQRKHFASKGFHVKTSLSYRNWAVDTPSTTTHSGGQVLASATILDTVRSPTQVSLIPQIKLRLDEFKVIDLLALAKQRLT